ncbi:XrtA/PEP-CTERM system TPR-repeat protein PrsT [Lacimicrobium sp. SS2-24]|uniref:XrtA/PEP-CTERM system TPR-repeat protein PrsT n=1 Tax=Lacimicrobium sp. SS2-24 TaxID=2005569 RepID=UPI001439DA75|nr:XrtA/PEP-CTERM system TPR-repeat protein PrsT [Lacimicrobium sp. SS2-24]
MFFGRIRQLIFIGCVAAVLVGCGNADPQQKMASARQFMLEQDTDAAIIELKQVIRAEPSNREARLLLGTAYLAQGSSLLAIKELGKADKFGARKAETVPLMVQALFMSQDFEALLGYIEEMPQEDQETYRQLIGFYSGWALLKLQRFEQSMETLGKLEPVEDKPYYLAGRALSAFLNQDWQAFSGYEAQLSEQYAEYADVQLLLGQLNYVKGQFDKAVAQLQTYERMYPKSIAGTDTLALAFMRLSQLNEAQRRVDRLLQISPGSAIVNRVAAMLAFQKQQYTQASDYAKRAIQQGDSSAQNYVIAGVSGFRNKEFEQAYFYLHPIHNHLSQGHTAKRIYHATQLMLGYHDAAFADLVEQQALSGGDVSMINYVSQALLQNKQADKARALMALTAPLSLTAQQMHQQGLLKLAMGDDSGLDMLKAAAHANDDGGVSQLAYAVALYQAREYEQARNALMPLEQKPEFAEQVQNVKALIAIQEKETDVAERHFSEALKADSGSLMANLFFARKALNDYQPQEAVSFLESALASHPANAKALTLYYVAQRILGEPEKAFIRTRKVYADNKGNESVALILAVIHANKGELDNALRVLTGLRKELATHSRDYWRLLSAFSARNDNIQQSIDYLNQWQNVEPDFAESYLKLAAHYESQGQLDKALTEVLEGRERLPEEPALALNHAHLLIEKKNYEHARRILEEFDFAEHHRTSAEGLYGDMLLAQGDLDAAQPKLSALYQARPTARNLAKLFNLYFRQQDHKAAIDLLKGHVEAFPDDNAVRLTLANELIRKQPQQAIALFEQALSYEPKNIDALHKLAWLMKEQGQLASALKYAEQAVELAPQNPVLLNLVGMIHAQHKEYGLARAPLSAAYKLNPKDIDAALNYAEVLIELDAFDEAKAILDSFANPLPVFARRIEALRERMG